MLNSSEQRPESFESLSDRLRWQTGGMMRQIGRMLAWTGLHPNVLTVAGLLTSIGAGVFASQGMFVRAAVTYLIGLSLDALDGPLARASGHASDFGAVLDSALDRYGEAALLAGLGFWMLGEDDSLGLMLVFATLTGSVLVSYVRARADGVDLEIKVGLMTRLERFVIMSITLFSSQIVVGLAIMTVLVNFTVLQRLAAVYRLTRDG